MTLIHLVDTGASYSIVPHKSPALPTGPNLAGPNGQRIDCWGETKLTLSFNGRLFSWTFLLADVKFGILGVDFLTAHQLQVDSAGSQLIEQRSQESFATVAAATAATAPPSRSTACVGQGGKSKVKTSTSSGGLSSSVEAPSAGPDTCAAVAGGLLPQEWLDSFLVEFADVVCASKILPPTDDRVQHHVQTQGPPIAARFRRLDAEKLAAAKAEFLQLEKDGIVRRSDSPWSSPLHMVRKKDGGWRPCGDYRRLNNVTVRDSYPLPNMMDFAATAAGCTIFSKIDLRKGYHQIPMHPDSIQKTAITTPFGSFEYLRMPFGLMNAGSTFQRKADVAVADLKRVFAYLDDMDVASKNVEDHKRHLRELFLRLREHNLVINLEKCVFGAPSIDFLGHRVSAAGVEPLDDHVIAIQQFPKPRIVKELQGFLGMVNFYRRFIQGAAKILKPLTDSLRGNVKGTAQLTWSAAMETAFAAIKQALSQVALLAHPLQGATLSLVVDASDTHVGACLQQQQTATGAWEPLGFYSKKLDSAQTKYSAFDRELLACYLGIRHFRYMLEGQNFRIYTDHKPLTAALGRAADPWTARQTRQLSYVAEYTTDIRHISGASNIVADMLSRPPGHAAAKAAQPPSADPGAVACQGGKTESSAQGWITAVADHAPLTEVNYAAMAVAQIGCPAVAKARQSPALSIERIKVQGAELYCDTSTGTVRPLVPVQFQRPVFAAVHSLAHPGIRATRRLITSRFVWPGCQADVSRWCRDCQDCQRGKVTKQPPAATLPIPVPARRFSHIHVDLVGPLPTSADGFRYLFTMIDRSTRWLEAVPVKNLEATTAADALVSGWVSRFGVPSTITSDRGTQFTGHVWEILCTRLGINHITTTAFHPCSNGMVERSHRQLKDALRSRLAANDWPSHLPWVLLGLRAAPKEESGVSSAELVTGAPLVLPGQLLTTQEQPAEAMLQQLRTAPPVCPPTRTLPPAEQAGGPPAALLAAQYVYIRKGGQTAPLSPLYSGPYAVIRPGPKFFKLQIGEKVESVSVDRLKPHTGGPVTPAAPPKRGRPPGPRTWAAVVRGT